MFDVRCSMCDVPRAGRWLFVFALAFVASDIALRTPGMAFAQSDAEHQQFLFAYKLLQRGELDEAAEQFDAYMGQFPRGEKLGDVQYYRALLYRKAGQSEKAATLLKDAAAPTLVPGYAVHLLSGQAWIDAQKYVEALGSLEKIDTDKLEPKVAVSALYLKGLAYRGAENLEAAATALGDASELDTPMKARALLDLAKVRALMKDQDKAMDSLDDCLKIEDPSVSPEAARFAGDLSYNAGKYGKAIGYYSTVVSRYQSSTHFAPAVIGLMWAQFADGRYTAVLQSFEASVAALPVQDRLPAYYLAGSAYQEQGEHAKAAEMLDKIAGGDASVALIEKVLYKLAVSRYELKQYDAMNVAAERMNKLFPQSSMKVDVAFLQATAEAQAGNVEKGVARLTGYVDGGPGSIYYGQALLRRAHLYQTNGKIEPAAADYEAYLAANPQPTTTTLQAGFRLMELLGALGKHDRVIELASGVLAMQDKALLTPETQQEALYRLAQAYRYKGKLDDALKTHDRLMSAYPINPYAANSVFEQGLIWMARRDAERGVPMLLDAAGREGLDNESKVNALRVVAQHDQDSGNTQRAFDLRMKMREIARNDRVLTDEEALWMAERLIESGDIQAAGVYAGQVAGKDQKERAMLLTGRIQRLSNDFDAAMQTLNEVRAVSERYNLEAWLEIAKVYRAQGKTDEALNELSALQDPDRGHAIASQALYEAGMIHKELAIKALRTDPGSAQISSKAGRDSLKKLWLLYPDREGETLAKWAALQLASLQHLSGDAEGEVKTLTELIESEPDTPHATLAKAVLAQRAGRGERSDTYLRQMIKQTGGDAAFIKLSDELLNADR